MNHGLIPMAKKKGRGFGRLLGRPYDRLMSRLEKIVKDTDEDDLGREIDKFVKLVKRQYDEENITDEDHDLLVEEAEEYHPDGKTYARLGDDSPDEFYEGDIPDAPEVEHGAKEVDLDELMRARDRSTTGSFGVDEFDEYRQRMSEEFFRESDEAVAAGDHYEVQAQDPGHRVFEDKEAEAERVKREIQAETGMDGNVTEEETDETYRVDDDGTEWWQDEEGTWWYRPPGEEDWYVWE